MRDGNDLLQSMKKAALEAVEASKPTSIIFGKVVSSSPLKIYIDQKMTLSKDQLILTRNVTNHTVNIAMNWLTQESESHTHNVTGTKTMTVNDALVIGDKVVMVRMPGGQEYMVIDRVGG